MKRVIGLLCAVVAVSTVSSASARSITGASFTQAGATTTVSVTFEAGEAGDDHALYVAFDVADRGATLAGWAAYQRVGRVAADATSATFTLLPSLTGVDLSVRHADRGDPPNGDAVHRHGHQRGADHLYLCGLPV